MEGLRAMANPVTFDRATGIFTQMIELQPDFAEVRAHASPMPCAICDVCQLQACVVRGGAAGPSPSDECMLLSPEHC